MCTTHRQIMINGAWHIPRDLPLPLRYFGNKIGNKKINNADGKYRNLTFRKKFVIYFSPLFMLVNSLIFEVFAIIPIFICMYVSMTILLAKNTCLWCNNPFLYTPSMGLKWMAYLFFGRPNVSNMASLMQIYRCVSQM